MCLLTMLQKLYLKFYLFLQLDLKIICLQTNNLSTFYIRDEELKFHFQPVQWSEDCTFKERSTSIISWRYHFDITLAEIIYGQTSNSLTYSTMI